MEEFLKLKGLYLKNYEKFNITQFMPKEESEKFDFFFTGVEFYDGNLCLLITEVPKNNKKLVLVVNEFGTPIKEFGETELLGIYNVYLKNK